MYVDNVREVLKNFDRVEYDSYLIRLRRILQKHFEKNVKPSVLRMRVDEFKNGKNPNIEYFEAYLLTFDEVVADGAIEALQSHKIEMDDSQQLLINFLSKNHEISQNNIVHLKNERVNKEMLKLLHNVINYCSDSSTENFLDHLRLFNRFISLKHKS